MKVKEAYSIVKGKKAPQVHDTQASDSLRYLQIKDLRHDDQILYALDPKGVVAISDDVLIAWDGANSGTVGSNLHGYVGSTLARLRSNVSDRLFAPYATRFLQSKFETLNSNTTGSTIPHVSKTVLENLKIPIPPLEQQKRIATILDKADELRAKRRRTIAKLDELLKSVFLEMFGDPVVNPFGIAIVQLQDVATKVTDGTHQSPEWALNGIPFLFVSNVVDGELTFQTSKFISEKTHKELTKRSPIEVRDILYTIVGSYGNAAMVETNELFAFQRHIAHIKPDNTKIDPYFLLGMLQSPGFRRQVDAEVRGIAQKTLNLRELKNLKVFKPPSKLQGKYAAIRHKILVERRNNQKALDSADGLFASLQARAFSGDLTPDVLDEVEAVAAGS